MKVKQFLIRLSMISKARTPGNLAHFLGILKENAKPACIALGLSLATLTGVGAPMVDFVTPPLGTNGPITGQVSGLASPSEYVVLLLTSQNNKIWWDKTHNVHGIPIAEDGTFTIGKGWVNHTNVLKAPYIGIWVVPTNFGSFSAEGTPLPDKLSQGAVASKIYTRTQWASSPAVDFVSPPLGTKEPITGEISGLATPSDYRVLMLVSANNKTWWDKTHNVHGIPIAEDGTFRIKGWVVDPHDLQVPYIGIWVVPANFGSYSAEGVALPEKIPQAAVASKLINRKDPLWRPLDGTK
jgi:hypothetical protein